MGPCIAGGAYLPALSDVIIMVDKTSFMGLGGANLVKGATGQVVDAESLGGARVHTSVSGVAHHLAAGSIATTALISGGTVLARNPSNMPRFHKAPGTSSSSSASSSWRPRRVP